MGEDGGNTLGGGGFAGGDGDEELDDTVIDAATAGLDDEDVFAADRVVDFDARFADGELGERDAAVGDAELVADCGHELGVGGAAEDDDIADHGGGVRGKGRGRGGGGEGGLSLERVVEEGGERREGEKERKTEEVKSPSAQSHKYQQPTQKRGKLHSHTLTHFSLKESRADSDADIPKITRMPFSGVELVHRFLFFSNKKEPRRVLAPATWGRHTAAGFPAIISAHDAMRRACMGSCLSLPIHAYPVCPALPCSVRPILFLPTLSSRSSIA